MTRENYVSTRKLRKQRVGAACDFCRQRKLGCDNAKPKCENCQFHSRDCTYSERAKKERPSNSRISLLEEDNTRLRKLVTKLKSDLLVEQLRNKGTNSQSSPIDNKLPGLGSISSESSNLPTASEHPSTGHLQATRFHGPSSVIFDEELPNKRLKIGSMAVGDSNAKNLLLAEAAKQRQLEHINFRSGRLNFDGVEQEFGMQLLSVFWNRQHHSGSTVYRPCFMRDMACQGPHFSPLLLNAMFFVTSKHLEKTQGQCCSTDSCTEGMPFRRRVEEILHSHDTQVLCRSKVTTIQALLLMSDALFSWCDERSLSWHYLGIAINMIVDLGIHTENSTFYTTNSRSTESLEVARRVFWAAFVLDKVQSIYQGRPARLREMDIQIPVIFLDEYEELEQFNTLSYSANPAQLDSPTHSVSTFEQLCKLSIIADRILCSLYAEKSLAKSPEDLFQTSYSLHADLIRWRESLPGHLVILDGSGSSSILPHTLSLLSMYNSLIILLKRPFVSAGHLQSVSDSAASDAFAICATAASDIDYILRLYKKHFCMKTTPYFLSYATYVSATVHVRIAAQMPYGSKAHRCLQTCLEVLSEHQIKCHAPRRSMSILLGLIGRLKVEVGDSFIAFSSRTSRLEAPSAEDANTFPAHGSAASLDHGQNNPTSEQAYLDDQQVDLATLVDVDIDKIMKTFNFMSPEKMHHSRTRGLLEDPRPYPFSDTGAGSNSMEEANSGSFPFEGAVDEFLLNFNAPFDYDPLFGFGTFAK